MDEIKLMWMETITMIYKGEMRTVNESDFIPVSFNEKEIFIYMI